MPTLDRAKSSAPLWGKLERTDAAVGLGWHSLVDHSADVAACMEGLLKLPVVRRRLARLAAVETVPAVWIQRIAAHTFLHDLGKANRGFQEAPAQGRCPGRACPRGGRLLRAENSVSGS